MCVCLCVQAVMAVADAVRAHKVSTLVVDPVLVATSGDSLAGSEVAEALKTHLFPLATVITPNLPEASALLGNRRVSDLATMKQASLIFHVFLGLVLGHASVFGHLVTPCSLPKHQSLLCNASPCRLPEYDSLLCNVSPCSLPVHQVLLRDVSPCSLPKHQSLLRNISLAYLCIRYCCAM